MRIGQYTLWQGPGWKENGSFVFQNTIDLKKIKMQNCKMTWQKKISIQKWKKYKTVSNVQEKFTGQVFWWSLFIFPRMRMYQCGLVYTKQRIVFYHRAVLLRE